MKHLNKIIFINSANIPYAEISVDGNVHFTGTQGVGKSTVLRALLFFYNADKHRLGIQQGQKTFDEFYFRQSNSHILYEVMRDNGAYTILVSRYQGRASWRFIDAPYQREWLIGEDKQVLSDWVKIRERIDKQVAVSARIDSGVMFRDIIFGNTRDHKYTRYALVQSAHYQNIPRSIQNVFLNTKLDADFVKTTIIQSMTDEDLPIDLQTYRRLVTDFEREYDEIDCWFRQTRDGNYPVRQQALKIAEQGRKIVALDQQLLDVWHRLNHAVAESEQQIPLLEAEEAELKTSIGKERAKEKELADEYGKERDARNQELGAKKNKLKEIAQTRKEFEAMGIEEKLALARREEATKLEAAEKQMLLDDLLKTHASIEEKYNIARGKLENAHQAFENAQKEAYYKKQAAQQTERKRLEEERTKNRNRLTEAFNDWRHESDERLEMLAADQHRADSAWRELRQWHPRTEDIKQVREQLQQLAMDERENAAQKNAVKSQIDRITAQYEAKEAELRQASSREQERLEGRRDQVSGQIAKIDGLLSHLEGSLYHWLCANAEGWESTIGKVVDEERILYAEGLEPQRDTASDSFFGVKLNLDKIDSVHHTPDEYREEKKALEEEVRKINRQLSQLPIELQDEISKLGKKYASEIKPLRDQATLLRVEEDQIPVKRQELEERQKAVGKNLVHRREGLKQYHQIVENEHLVPDTFLSDDKATTTSQDCQQLLSQLRGTVNQKRESIDKLKAAVVGFNRNFKPQNAFHFNTMPVTDHDYLQIAVDLQDFMDNNKIEEFRRRTSEHYKDILGRISTEIGALMRRRSDVDRVIQDINRDFVEKNFAGVIKSIELRANESSDKLMRLLMSIHDYTVENEFSIGELNLFSGDNRDEVNRKVVDYLKSLAHQLLNEPNRPKVSLGDAFRLQFRVKENDNDTLWVERINNVGSDGTDILVKAMVNIMLINVFKKKAAKKSGDFIVHCMMDEIGRLHPNNIKGILQFANSRNIYLINSSPTSYNPYDYRYTYLLSKQGVKTRVEKLLKRLN